MKLNENYSIEFDENNAVLVFKEIRIKKPKKNEMQDCGMTYEAIERFYYPNVKTCLNAFIQKDLHGSTDVLNILNRIDKLEKIISNLNN